MSLPADYHLHTNHSSDSQAPMKDMIEAALAHGLKEICFTDHMDFKFPYRLYNLPPTSFTLDTASYRAEWEELSELYADRITVRFGVELGMRTDCVAENEAFLKANDFDFVIGSLHLVNDKDPYYPDFFDGITEEEALRMYLRTTIDNVKLFHDFDVLGHPDYVIRCFPSGNPLYDYSLFEAEYEELFTFLVEHGIGIDCNTRPQREGFDIIHPTTEALKLYKRLGGRIITFGSDAHRPDNMAIGFSNAVDIVRSAGFTEYCTFKGREPVFHSLRYP